MLAGLARLSRSRSIAIPSARVLQSLDVFDARHVNEIERIRRMRNSLVHGIEAPDPEFIQETGATIEQIMGELLTDPRPDIRLAAERALGRGV